MTDAAPLSAPTPRGPVPAEPGRWILALPVLMGLGVAAYFALEREPPAWLGPTAAGVLALLVWRWRHRTAVYGLLALLAVAAGFGAAQIRTAQVAAPVLTAALGPTEVTGRVVDVARDRRGWRLRLDRLAITGLEPGRTPAAARLRVAGDRRPAGPGDRIAVRARLYPPAPPVAPGAYDFPRRAWFDRLGATGYGLGRVRVLDRARTDSLARLRLGVAERVELVLAPPVAGIAAALVTGRRDGIAEPVAEAMRAAGLAHLLAISGLHVGLVALFVFLTLRLGLAAVPAVALRWPIKKIAALGALAAVVGFTILVGAPVTTIRAAVMTSLALIAVMADRAPISLRLVAWAAVVVLAVQPEALLGPSFQMSFAAVVALVAVYERYGGLASRWRRGDEAGATWRLPVIYFAGVLATTVIATLATAPYAAFHFHRLALYGLAANLIAVPVTTMWVMPGLLIALILMPLGLDGPALIAAGWGLEVVVAVAQTVAAWPGAVIGVPAMPLAALALITLGGLWLALWSGRGRGLGLGVLGAGILVAILAPRPDILVSADGGVVAVRGADGGLRLSARGSNFLRDVWAERDGHALGRPWPESGTDGWLNCTPAHCRYETPAGRAVILRKPGDPARWCDSVDIILAPVPLTGTCPPGASAPIVDPLALWRFGAHAIRLGPGAVDIDTARDRRGWRPWAP